MTTLPRDRQVFRVAIICALPLEADCVHAVFDEPGLKGGEQWGKAPGDINSYTTGVIGRHNVVLAYMPEMGKVSAASVASSLKISFPRIKLAIVVGICGGVPFTPQQDEICLGDVIVSRALVQYDFGRQVEAVFERKATIEDSLGRPTAEIRSLLAKLQTLSCRREMQNDLSLHLSSLERKLPTAKYIGSEFDRLYESSYIHKHRASSDQQVCRICGHDDDQVCPDAANVGCDKVGCDNARLIVRQRLTSANTSSRKQEPFVHYGRMGSGDTVMKSGTMRDRIAHADNIIAFEMEGAGVWDHFPCIVIKGVCDYADSHKNKSWQGHAAATAACCMKALLNQWTPEDQPADQGRYPDTNVNVLWHVPFDKMPTKFVGRWDHFRSLQRSLFQSGGNNKVAVYGLGGIGKSRIAWELANYARSQLKGYSVFWVQANSASTVEKDYEAIGDKLQIAGLADKSSSVKDLVKQRLTLESAGKWLMILDNADDESLWNVSSNQSNGCTVLADYLPKSRLGSVLVTTRSRSVAVRLAGKDVVDLQQLTPTEAVETMRSLLVNPDITADADAALKLVDQLSYLPLAIVQAAAYININGCSINEYLELDDGTEEGIIELLSEEFDDETRYQHATNSVASTWLTSFKQIQRTRPMAIEFLFYMSCLSENSIPQSLLPEVSKRKDFLEIIGTLTGYSFIRKQTQDHLQGPLYNMHRLVRLSTRNWLRHQNGLSSWTETTVKRMAFLLPDVNYENFGTLPRPWTLYMPHAKILCQSAHGSTYTELYVLLRKIGRCLVADGFHSEAVKTLVPVVHWTETWLGDSEVETFGACGALAEAYCGQCNWLQAERFALKAYEGYRRLLGPDHKDTLEGMSDLVAVYTEQGRLTEAESLGAEGLERCKIALGANHLWTHSFMGNLARVYQDQGRWMDAENLVTAALATSRSAFGPEGYGIILMDLEASMLIYNKQGRFVEAELLAVEGIEASRRILGLENIVTLGWMGKLAFIYFKEGKAAEAESLGVKTLDMMERILGHRNPDTLKCMANLAWAMRYLGHLRKAHELMSRCSELSAVALGPDHPDTTDRREWLSEYFAFPKASKGL